MNKQMNHLMLVVIAVFLFSACGPLEALPAPTEAPELMVTVTEDPINIPTADPVEGSTPESFSRYVGLSYPPFPVGLTQHLSMLIQNSDDHGLWLVSDGADEMLWLSKITQYNTTNGNPYWEVKDVLGLSNVEAGTVLIPDGCSLNGQPDNEILVAAKNGTLLLAWRANTTSNVFEVIPTDGIECHSDKGVSLE
jgi:hypothetical protein